MGNGSICLGKDSFYQPYDKKTFKIIVYAGKGSDWAEGFEFTLQGLKPFLRDKAGLSGCVPS